MEKLKDFFYELQNRVTNPLISSFAISWLFVNWKIPIGLLTEIEILEVDGYKSYFQLINSHISFEYFFLIPFIYALLYTFGFPFIRTWILAFNTRIKYWSTNWNLDISKSAKIPFEKYIDLRQKYEDKQKTIEKIEKESSEIKDRYEEEVAKNNELRKSIDKNSEEYSKIRSDLNDMKIIQGSWRFLYPRNSDGETKGERIFIHGAQISIINSSGEDVKFYITDFHHNPINRTIVFCRVDTGNEREWRYHSLRYNEYADLLEGTENKLEPVKYIKMN